MLATIRKYRRPISIFFLFNFITGALPYKALALTSGPSAPETQQFAPAGLDNMVDPFTGDFNYNIPLMDVGGYPINLNYAAGITPDAEASWVGLGWNLNVGAVNRSIRGIPDDFAGDEIETEHHIKPNQTFGLTFSPPSKERELFTFKLKISKNYNISYNTYNGFGFSYSYSPSLDIPILKKQSDSKYKLGMNVMPSLSLSLGSEGGVGITPSVGLKTAGENANNSGTLNTTIGFPFSSREGAKGMSMSTSFNASCLPPKTYEGSDFHGFSTPTYTTNIEHSFYSINGTLNITPENIKDIAQDKPLFVIGGYYNGQFAKSEKDVNPSYGYMYEGISQDPNSVLDFNREKDGGYNEKTTNMPLTNHTYDIYSVQGEGVGGTYRLYRGDVATVGDNEHTDETISPDLALSGGFNPLDKASFTDVKLGIDFKYLHSQSSAGRWYTNKIQSQVNPLEVPNKANQNTYFGKVGDTAPENSSDYYNETLLGEDLYEYYLAQGFVTGEYQKKDRTRKTFNKNSSPTYLRGKRRNRSESFTYLTAAKAKKFAMTPIYNYAYNTFTLEDVSGDAKKGNLPYSKEEIQRVENERKGHHISEVRVVNNSGSRYVYSTPVYNKEQHDVTFSVDVNKNKDKNTSLTAVRQSGLVKYSDEDATLGNKNGLEHYYKRTKLKGSASSYLLNYILSSDYVDSDNIAGPSDGDLGTYVKFNYSRTSTDYKWRTPYEKNMANYNDGLSGKRDDDKASYSYGSKEVWYLHSIETRTHVAEFYLEDRKDGLGVENEHGGMKSQDLSAIPSENKLKCLKKIILYAKADKLNEKNPEPLKTVYLDYTYKLCPKTLNSLAEKIENEEGTEHGKLTLKKVWFTYGLSNKGILNPYTFEYDQNKNPYNSKNYDRWGFYKEQGSEMGNEVFPYTDQDKTNSDRYAAAYSLSKIFTPTGGEMRVHYESDDYGYVQNKPAMRMFTIKGVTNTLGSDNYLTELYDIGDLKGNRFLHINLGDGFKVPSGQDPLKYFYNNYIADLSTLQYKIKLKVLNGKPGVPDAEEFVTGYCSFQRDITKMKVKADDDGVYRTATIFLDTETLNNGGSEVHPFAKNGWLFARLNYNRELMGSANASDNGLLQIVASIASSMTSVLEFMFGFRLFMSTSGHSKTFVPKESFIRLYEHDKIKLGGGHRVKAIIMLDRWKEMKSDREGDGPGKKELSGYGQVYNYTIPENLSDPNSRVISSGVAAYEPIIGGEENSLRNLVKTTDKVPMAPNKDYYTETPYGESFYPAPSVGYRRVRTTPVKVLNGTYDVNNLVSNGTGYIEDEFYTAMDFPTFVSQTDLEPYRNKSPFNPTPLKITSHDYVSCSQGYLIELNDMHGKPKSKKVMPDAASGSSDPISYVYYEYKVKGTDRSRLDNAVPLVGNDMNVISSGSEIGKTVDVVNDTRYYNSETIGGGADINLKMSIPKPPYFFIPQITAFPDVNYETTGFSSITTTKVVNRHGVLIKTTAEDNGQAIVTENLLWDKETGQVLLTKVQNEFHDPLYNFTYPGYWAYKEMGLAYQNEGFQFNDLNTYVKNVLIDGDEVICTVVENGANKDLYAYYDNNRLIKKDGKEVTKLVWGQVIRSGARNMPMTPIGQVSTVNNPVQNNKVSFENAKVLNTSASEYKNVWKGFCNCGEQSTNPVNPYITGQKGQLRPWRSWTYLTERTQSIVNGEVNIRTDGSFTDYRDFWNAGIYLTPFYKLSKPENYKWQYVNQIMNYNPIGMEIENKDTIGRYSMAQFGYGRNLPVATSNNSEYQESGFDGFEDYEYGDCNDDHFSWRARQNDVNYGPVTTEAHTGRKSFKVPAKSRSKIVKIIDPCNK